MTTQKELIETVYDLIKNYSDHRLVRAEMCDDMVEIIKDNDVAPIIRGKCSITHGMYENRIWCNNCGFIKVITGEEENYNFCPKCGAIAERSKQ